MIAIDCSEARKQAEKILMIAVQSYATTATTV